MYLIAIAIKRTVRWRRTNVAVNFASARHAVGKVGAVAYKMADALRVSTPHARHFGFTHFVLVPVCFRGAICKEVSPAFERW